MIARRAVLAVFPGLVAAQATIPAVNAQSKPPLLAFLVHGSEESIAARLQGFRLGLRDLGYAEGRNYNLELRATEGDPDRLAPLAREIVQLRPDVAVAPTVVAAEALWRESRTLPIVMAGGAGATQSGIVASLSRPGGNVTGVTNQGDDLTQKLLELVRDVAPDARRVLAVSSGRGFVESDVRRAARDAAAALGMTLIDAWARTTADIASMQELCRREGCEAIVFLLDPILINQRSELIAATIDLRLPAVFPVLEFAAEGGLLTYASDPVSQARRAAMFVDRILRGTKPGDLPIEQPVEFRLVVNLRTARAIGLTIPQVLLLRADEVIE